MTPGVAQRNKRYILEQLASGKRLFHVASELSISAPTLCIGLRREPEYLEARRRCDQVRILKTAQSKDADARKALKRHVWRYVWDFGPDEWLVEQGLAAPDPIKLSTIRQRNAARLKPGAKGK